MEKPKKIYFFNCFISMHSFPKRYALKADRVG